MKFIPFCAIVLGISVCTAYGDSKVISDDLTLTNFREDDILTSSTQTDSTASAVSNANPSNGEETNPGNPKPTEKELLRKKSDIPAVDQSNTVESVPSKSESSLSDEPELKPRSRAENEETQDSTSESVTKTASRSTPESGKSEINEKDSAAKEVPPANESDSDSDNSKSSPAAENKILSPPALKPGGNEFQSQTFSDSPSPEKRPPAGLAGNQILRSPLPSLRTQKKSNDVADENTKEDSENEITNAASAQIPTSSESKETPVDGAKILSRPEIKPSAEGDFEQESFSNPSTPNTKSTSDDKILSSPIQQRSNSLDDDFPAQDLLNSKFSREPEPLPQAAKLPIVIIVVFGGFRKGFIDRETLPTLMGVADSGASVKYLQPSFPSRTFPNLLTIATGLYPSYHGLVNNVFYDSDNDHIYNVKEEDAHIWAHYPEAVPFWVHNEQAGGVSGCMMWPGSAHPYGPKQKQPTYFYPKYNQSMSWETRVDTVMTWLTHKEKPANLVYIYYHEPDACSHYHGPEGRKTKEQLHKADQRYKYLLDQLDSAGLGDKANLILMSDHGTQQVLPGQTLDFDTIIPHRRELVETVFDKSALLQVMPLHGKKHELHEVLLNASRTNHFTVYKKSDLCGPPFYYCQSTRIHDFLLLADPGWAILDSYEGEYIKEYNEQVYGNHGYLNTIDTMHTFLIAKGPLFKEGFRSSSHAENVDLFSLLCKIYNVAAPSNGTLSRLDVLLKK